MVDITGNAPQTNFEGQAQPIRLIHSQRAMRCYTVTDSELRQIGLANLGMTATFGLGSASFAFWLDVYKDIALASELPEAAKALTDVVQPVFFWAAVAFWLISGALAFWRHQMVGVIKTESK